MVDSSIMPHVLTHNLPATKKGFNGITAKPLVSNGAPGKIRTLGRRLRRPLLYPTELLARVEG